MISNEKIFSILTAHLRFYRSNGQLTFKNRAYKRDYWIVRGLEYVYDWFLYKTSFLPEDTSFSVRFYFIENKITSIPNCPVCCLPINLPKSYNECLPTTHNTCLRAFVDHKIKQTCEDRWGGNPMKSPEVLAKLKQSQQKVDKKEREQKRRHTILKKNPKYGLKKRLLELKHQQIIEERQKGIQHAKQRHINPEVLKLINDPSWLENEYQNKAANAIALEMGVNKTIIQNRIHKFNIPVIKRYTSIEEREISDLIESYGVNVNRTIQTDAKFELDIFLPDLNIAIEYHGLYWHVEKHTPHKNIHQFKYDWCKRNGILLLQIWSNEWKNQKSIVLRKIQHLLKHNKQKSIGARNCKVLSIDKTVADQFCITHHLQQEGTSDYRCGLFHKDQLVYVMTFEQKTHNSWEILRFCSNERNVVGGASKLFNHFVKTHNPQHVITYSDNRYHEGAVYEKLGMVKTKQTSAGFCYVNLAKPTTVHECIPSQEIETNFDKIWDCGRTVFEWFNS